jgi:hypothetical protein
MGNFGLRNVCRCAWMGSVCGYAFAVGLFLFAARPQPASAQHQLSLAPINLLPNAPSTYSMRDWATVATNFDSLAFDTTATGQFLPIPIRDDTPESPFLSVAYELPSYVGDNRMYGNGETFAEGIPTLGAVLGSTLMGIDKSAGPLNWVSMTREYYINRNNEFIMMNRTDSASGHSAWYDILPNILFYAIADRYPNETYLSSIQNQIDSEFYTAVNVMTAGGTAPNFNWSAFDFSDNVPRFNGTWREPNMGLGMAWMQHSAYWRNRNSAPAAAALHLQAVDWALAYYETRTTNPHYEALTGFGAYAAARMNAEHGRNFNVHKYLDWVFSRSAARPDIIMISGQQWGGQDVGGLMGGMRACCSNPTQGYAFAMNTFLDVIPVVPMARYEDRYSRSIGKWMLNAANASRLFYGNAHPNNGESSEFWTGDPNYAIAYEGLRHYWQTEKPGENQALYAAGDPLTYGWGPLTDFGIYGSAFVGALGSTVRTTNIEKILQVDLLATDFYRAAAHPTYLYYNPYATPQSVAIELGTGQFDLYDAVSNRFLARNATGQSFFTVPQDNAVQLVLVPAGGAETRDRRKLLVGGVVIDYNATLLPDNLVRNPDVDTPTLGSATAPSFWHRSTNATWSKTVALSPTHSLELVDNSATRSEEWRTYAGAIPEGENRTLDLRWFWKYNIGAGDEFRARLRLSTDASNGVDLTNPTVTLDFTISGTVNDFEMFETALAIADAIRSFDLTFITGGLIDDVGSLYVDDISVALAAVAPVLAGDYNDDGVVDAADYVVWRNTLGGTSLPNETVSPGIVDQADYSEWRVNFGNTAAASAGAVTGSTGVPEPSGVLLILMASASLITSRSFLLACGLHS